MKYCFTIALLFSSLFAVCQKELKLEEAVMGQYQKFYPEQLHELSWVPNSFNYAYLEDYVKLVIGNIKTGEENEVLNIDQFNKVFGSELYYFQNLTWKDSTSFYVNNENTYYQYDLSTKQGKACKLNIGAKNSELNLSSGNIAFTEKNNLFIFFENSGKIRQITKIKDTNIVSGQAIARREMGISKGTFWSPKGNYLAFYQKDESAVHNYPLLNIDSYPGELNIIKYPMAGQDSEKPKVGIYNVKKNKTKYISPRNGVENYLTNVSWSPDEEFIVIVEVDRSQKHLWVDLYNAKNGKFIRTLFEEKRSTWVEPQHPAFFPNKDNNDFVWMSERDGYNNLYLYSIEGELIKQLTKNKFVAKTIMQASESGSIYFTATGENPLNTLLFNVDQEGNQRLVTRNEGTHKVNVHPSKNIIFDTYNSHNIPNRVLLLNDQGEELGELLNVKNPLKNYTLGTTEIKTIENEEGSKLFTRLIKPSHFDENKKYPVLIYVYGGPHAQLITNSWLNGAALWMYWLAEQGYLVFTVDNRGSSNRGVEFEHTVHRRLGTKELEDQLTGVKYLKSLPYADLQRIAVHGWSFGGFMTGTMMLKAPEVFNVGVAGGPVTDWKYYEIMYGERYMDTPEQNPEGYAEASLMEHADKLQGDLLLIHGTMDDVVVMQHNLVLVKKFVELGKHVDFFPYPMHKHNVRGKDRVHLMEKVLHYILEKNQ